MLFLSPTPIRTVLLAKNLLHGMLFCLVAILAGVFATLRLGVPDGALIAATATWLLFALPLNLGSGQYSFADDALSSEPRATLAAEGIAGKRTGEHADPGLCDRLRLGDLELCTYFDKSWLAAPCLLVLAGVALVVWWSVLRKADSLANRNRDT